MNTTVWLSQVQSLVSLGFISLFLVLELGLVWALLLFKIANHFTQGNAWMLAYRFWVRVYALAAIVGLAACVPLLIQVGSLWPGLLDRIGDVSGPLLAAAILTTFVVKSCFTGAMLFAQRGLSDLAHTGVVLMVALGTTLAVFWALSLFGWMQTPAGVGFLNGKYYVTNWYEVVFNPSAGWLLLLALSVSGMTVAFLMLGVTARKAASLPADDSARHTFRTGIVTGLLSVLVFAVAIAGYGRLVTEHQPAKAAATSAYWQSNTPADLPLIGWPDERESRTRGEVSWPEAGTRWLGHDNAGNPLGLDRFSGMHPPVALTFWSFRLTVIVSVLMVIAACGGMWCMRRKYIEHGDMPAGWRHMFSGLTMLGWLATVALVCHVLAGLAPFVVNQTVTFLEVAASVKPMHLVFGIAAHLVVYAVLLAGFFHLLRHGMQYGVVPVARRRGRA